MLLRLNQSMLISCAQLYKALRQLRNKHLPIFTETYYCDSISTHFVQCSTKYGPGHETGTVLLPGFAIN